MKVSSFPADKKQRKKSHSDWGVWAIGGANAPSSSSLGAATAKMSGSIFLSLQQRQKKKKIGEKYNIYEKGIRSSDKPFSCNRLYF